MAIGTTADFATIGTTEYFLMSDSTTATYQTDDAVVQGFIDFTNLVAGDEYEVRIYEKVNAGTATETTVWTVNGLKPDIVALPSMVLTEGWEISVTKTAGTDRSIAWSIRKVT